MLLTKYYLFLSFKFIAAALVNLMSRKYRNATFHSFNFIFRAAMKRPRMWHIRRGNVEEEKKRKKGTAIPTRSGKTSKNEEHLVHAPLLRVLETSCLFFKTRSTRDGVLIYKFSFSLSTGSGNWGESQIEGLIHWRASPFKLEGNYSRRGRKAGD